MQAIAAIDKEITQIHRQLQAIEHINPMSAASWERAWVKHPELREREKALFIQRANAKIEADEKAYQALVRGNRRQPRLKKCPTCGSKSLAA